MRVIKDENKTASDDCSPTLVMSSATRGRGTESDAAIHPRACPCVLGLWLL